MAENTVYYIENIHGTWDLYRYYPEEDENRLLSKHPTMEEALDAIAGDDTDLPAMVMFSTGNIHWEAFER